MCDQSRRAFFTNNARASLGARAGDFRRRRRCGALGEKCVVVAGINKTGCVAVALLLHAVRVLCSGGDGRLYHGNMLHITERCAERA